MELGALVCTPAAPRCPDCPVKRHCVAFARGQQDDLPPVVGRRATVKLRRAVVRLFHRGRLLVVQRQGAVLNGLWEPPGVDLGRGDDAATRLHAALKVLNVNARLADRGERVRHTITHRDIDVRVFEGTLVGVAPRATARLRWIRPGSHEMALSALARRVIAGVARAGD
jgi:A/G-specific adenine glycosylase